MPFIKPTDLKDPQVQTESHERIFVGRAKELLFFRDHIFQPVAPTYNIISISGNGGVGKTTLLTQIMNMARLPNFKNYVLPALVDNRQASPDSVMGQFVSQLPKNARVFKKFENALGHYREGVQQQQVQREAEHKDIEDALGGTLDTVVRTVPEPAGGILQLVAGDPIKSILDFFMRKFEDHQRLKEIGRLDSPLDTLTRAFVEGLNRLAGNGYRIILCFDCFGQLAPTLAPWLLDTFLESDIHANVVLVIASRAPIEASTPDGYKRWQKYHDNHDLCCISLANFTKEETATYLKTQGITDPKRSHSIYQISRGLPYYLALLVRNQQGDVDPTKSLVDNFLRRIPEQAQNKRQLVLEAALLTRPFNQDDLKALPNIAAQDIPALFDWLTGQPFVRCRSRDGRYYYDELVQELFCRAVYQHTTSEYEYTRRALAKHYQKQLELLQQDEGQASYESTEWLELVLALVHQLLLLPDQASHIQAIGLVIRAYVYLRHTGEIATVLHELFQNQSFNLANANARTIAAKLLKCMESDLASQDFLEANSYLLDTAAHEPSFPPELLATIYLIRGRAYSALRQYDRAMQDFNQSITLAPEDALGYGSRGFTYYLQKEYQRAIQDFDQALALDPGYAQACAQRGLTYRCLNEYKQAITDFNRAIALNPKYAWAYGQRGKTYRLLKNYAQAIQDCNQAITLNPRNAWAFAQRGLIHLWLNEVSRAQLDYARGWEINSKRIDYGWMAAWSEMSQEGVAADMAERLEEFVAIDQQSYLANVCRGTALWLRKSLEQALRELEQAISLEPEMWDAHFWKGMTSASLEHDEDAMKAIEKALEVGLPPVLLTPLSWFEHSRPEFYEKYVVPLLNRYK
jgi:tetratricopeptide (TPR) repeat protein